MSLTPVECQGDAHPLLLRDHQLQSEVVVYGDLDILFGAQIVVLLIIWHILVQIIWHTVASGAPRRFAGHLGAPDSGRTVPAPHILTLEFADDAPNN